MNPSRTSYNLSCSRQDVFCSSHRAVLIRAPHQQQQSLIRCHSHSAPQDRECAHISIGITASVNPSHNLTSPIPKQSLISDRQSTSRHGTIAELPSRRAFLVASLATGMGLQSFGSAGKAATTSQATSSSALEASAPPLAASSPSSLATAANQVLTSQSSPDGSVQKAYDG